MMQTGVSDIVSKYYAGRNVKNGRIILMHMHPDKNTLLALSDDEKNDFLQASETVCFSQHTVVVHPLNKALLSDSNTSLITTLMRNEKNLLQGVICSSRGEAIDKLVDIIRHNDSYRQEHPFRRLSSSPFNTPKFPP